MRWPNAKLESLALDVPYAVVGGPFGSKLTVRDYVEDGIPVIRGSNLNNGRFISFDDVVFVTEDKVRTDLFGNLAGPGDLVFTQRGTLGQVALIPEGGPFDQFVVSQSQMKMTVDSAKSDSLFLYYYFSSQEAIDRILSYTSSSGVPHINLTVLRNFEVPVPPISVQRRIASILSAYDELIENNRRRIRLLEEAARLLYREWFVHFRFPGHEHVKIIDGVPERWERKTLGEVCEKITDGAHKSPPSVENGKLMASVKDMHEWGLNLQNCRHISPIHFNELVRNDCQPLPNDILVAKDGANLNKHTFLVVEPVDAVLLSSIAILRPGNSVEPEFLLAQLRDESVSRRIKQSKSGVAIPRIVLRDFRILTILLPSMQIQKEWKRCIAPVHGQCRKLIEVNNKLRAARDLLLPRLMNGEIVV
ncbi:MAG: restriction endonuclease subunit S [Magnetococcales bacterium]|nr:restriction endonuclease subunit S [Magnetococcales bacterium]